MLVDSIVVEENTIIIKRIVPIDDNFCILPQGNMQKGEIGIVSADNLLQTS